MSAHTGTTILQHGDPLGFKVHPGTAQSGAIAGTNSDIFKIEARALSGHQKEAVISQGESGSVWRIACDEGKVMNGDDLAPFPLGFFNVGVMSDIYNRLKRLAAEKQIELTSVQMGMSQLYGASGSFIHSTATAHVESCRLNIALNANIDAVTAKALVHHAFDASPAIALLRTPMSSNTFALYINGRRCKVITHKNSAAKDATDPYLAYKTPPRPCQQKPRTDLIRKSDNTQTNLAELVPLNTPDKRLFAVAASGRSLSKGLEFETDTWIDRPGMSRFSLISDESETQSAPSGLGLMSAGIGFCYLTQLMRYVEAQKFDIHNARLVQFNPYMPGTKAQAGDIDTHLFLSGNAPDEAHLNLLSIAARTCFMHVATTMQIEPEIEVALNGQPVT